MIAATLVQQQKGSVLVRYGPVSALIIASFFSADTPLFLFGVGVFIFFYYQFLNLQAPPVILFIFFFQWFFNQGQLILALINGQVPLSSMFVPGESVKTVYYLGMIGSASFFLGVLYFYRKVPGQSLEQLRRFAYEINVDKMLLLYVASYLMQGTVASIAYLFPGLRQPLVMLLTFKWSLLVLLIVAVFVHRKHMFILFLLIGAEFVLGFASFWASFKDVVYVAFIAYWIFYFRGSVLIRWTLPVIVAFMVYIGSIWTVIKQDYRDFLNSGTGLQTSLVTREQALDKFTELAKSTSDNDIDKGFDDLILRMSWIGAFNKVYNHVPAKVPYSNGSLWTEGITRPFMPRLLFPEKKSLSDSKELNYYSGLHVDEENTSISLSTIAGSYVDFGPVWMHLPLFLFGLFFGWVYRRIFRMASNFLLAHALSVPLIFIASINEQSINRMVSSVVLYLAIVWFVCRFLQGPLLRFITNSGVRR